MSRFSPQYVYGTAVPTSGYWRAGDSIIHPTGRQFWRCVASGEPGTWVVGDGGSYVLASSAVAITAPADLLTNTLVTVPVPAGALGLNGRLRVTTDWTLTNNANNKTLQMVFGGSALAAYAGSGTGAVTAFLEVVNRNSAASQRWHSHAFQSTAINTGASGSAIDTTVNQNLLIQVTKAVGGDVVTLESYLVELLYGL